MLRYSDSFLVLETRSGGFTCAKLAPSGVRRTANTAKGAQTLTQRAPALYEKALRPMKVRIFVRLKPGVLDPQGRAVHHSLEGLGFDGVDDVRIGRLIEMDVADTTSRETLTAMCEKLLANTVVEDFTIEAVETTGSTETV